MNILEKRLKEKYPKEALKVLEYTSMKSPAKVKCMNCGSVYTLKAGENFLAKHKKCVCQKCFNNHSGGRYDIVTIQERIKVLFPLEDLEVIQYNGMKEPCDVLCRTCNSIYTYQRAENVINSKKQSVCKICVPNKYNIMQAKRNEFLDFISQSQDFILLEDNLDNIYSQDTIKTQCVRCGKINEKTINDYLRGRGCQCGCSNTLKTLEEANASVDSDYEIIEYNGMEHPALIRHRTCGLIYRKNPKYYTCPKCAKAKSKGEAVIRELLDKYNIEYNSEQLMLIEGHKLRFDFYIPDKNLFIEFQGIQHYEPVKYFGGVDKFQKQQELDELKRDFCKKNNFTLIEISYKDLENAKIFDILQPLLFNDHLERE